MRNPFDPEKMEEDYLNLIAMLSHLSTERAYQRFDEEYGSDNYLAILNHPQFSEVKTDFRNSLIEKYWYESFTTQLRLMKKSEVSAIELLSRHSPEYGAQYGEGVISLRQLVNFSLDL